LHIGASVPDDAYSKPKVDEAFSINVLGWIGKEFCCFQSAMEVMGLIAVVVNCALIGLSGQVHRMFPEMSTTQTILLIVALEVRNSTEPSVYVQSFTRITRLSLIQTNPLFWV